MTARWRSHRGDSRCFLALLIAIGVAHPAQAQLGCSGSICTMEITMPVNDVLRISLSTTGVGLGTPIESDYSVGYRDVSGAAVTAMVQANRAFQVQVVGGNSVFTYAGPHPDPLKVASDLRWATSQPGLSGASNHMGASGVLMNQGASAGAQASLYLRTLWDFTGDLPGTYSMPIRFTLSAP